MPRKEFYLRKLGKRGKITIWLVDGGRIRSELEEEFTNFGQHFRFSCIPEYEFWIDKEAVPDERPYVLLHELYERSLMAKGITYTKAHRKASKLEWQVRHDQRNLQEKLTALGWNNNHLSQTKPRNAIK